MLRIPWTAKKQRSNGRGRINKTIGENNKKKWQATFIGHIMRRESLEHFSTMGKLERR